MTLKERIENMKLPAHNGPAKRKMPVVMNKRIMLQLAKRFEEKYPNA